MIRRYVLVALASLIFLDAATTPMRLFSVKRDWLKSAATILTWSST